MTGKPFFRAVTAFLLLCALVVKCTYAVDVKFYSGQNYVGYVAGQSFNDQYCHQLDKRTSFNSVKTDSCLILFSKPGCFPVKAADCSDPGSCKEYTIRVDKDTPQFQSDDTLAPWSTSRYVYSFMECRDYDGGPFLNVDLYMKSVYQYGPVQSWTSVCTCQNVPEDYRLGENRPMSIFNHYNDMEIFSEENCQGESDHLPAGDNLATLFTVFHNPKFNVSSFRPSYLPDCIAYTAEISKFYFKSGTSKKPIIRKIRLGTRGRIENDAAADLTEHLQISETVTQTVNFSIPVVYTHMDNVGVTFSATYSGEPGVPLVLEPTVWEDISSLYKYTKGNPTNSTSILTVSTQTPVQSSQEITVPACHSCTLNAFVNQAVNYPIKYASYANVQASLDNQQMNATELKANLPTGVDYIKAVDDLTVVAVTRGTMYAQYGLDVFIETDCKPIPNCTPNHVSTKGIKTTRGQSTEQGSTTEIGTCMGKEGNWNSLSESSFPY